ncbi:MAG: UGSC family (seleno)protein [Candidatus Acidiferrales bacterium]
MPGLRVVALNAEKYYRSRSSAAEVQPVVDDVFEEIVDDLTRPATSEEIAPEPPRKEAQTTTIRAGGRDYNEAAERVNQLFLDNLWADGLPIVPPTAEAVERMLAGTTRSRDEVLGPVAPKGGIATIEKIAINSVMAGAKPEYLPAIIGAMEIFTDKHYDTTHMQASTGAFTPVIIFNGPLARELKFNSGIGLLGHGWRANSTVGRALRLCLLNLGWTWPAVNDMSLTGRFEAYTFFTFAENEASSPWEPYHVSLGFKAEESTATVATAGTAPMVLGGGAVFPWTGQGVIDTVIATISPLRFGWFHSQNYVLVLHPNCAADLAKAGYTRRSLQEYLYDRARVPYEAIAGATAGFSNTPLIDFLHDVMADGRIRADRAPIFRDALKPGGRVPVVQSPDDFHIIVAGGSPGYDLLFSYPGPNRAQQTKKITGATLTKAGR